MGNAVRQAVAPLYLLLCLLFGGSAQGLWTNAALQMLGLAIIAWAAIDRSGDPVTRPARQLFWLLIAGLSIVALQLIPLPPALWPHLGGRADIVEGYRILGVAIPARPLSLDPYNALATLLTLIPAIAMFCAIVRLRASRPGWLALAVLAAAFAGIMLGALQVSSPDPRASTWYLYRQSSFGFATGFFANANHMAMLLLVALPFVAALAVSVKGAGFQGYSAAIALASGAALILIVGIVLNRSLAGYGLAIPVLVASALLMMRRKSGLRRGIAVAAGVLALAALVVLAWSPVGERTLDTSSSVTSRAVIMSTTAEATKDFMPFGSGLGTFRGVYQLYEDHQKIDVVRVNHAHNDYLELALELGLPGIVLILLFLTWWGHAVWRAWRYADAGPYAQAASIASATLLAHSLVEFPLRTAALGACFAMCLALLIERRTSRGQNRADLRPTRHVVLD